MDFRCYNCRGCDNEVTGCDMKVPIREPRDSPSPLYNRLVLCLGTGQTTECVELYLRCAAVSA
jgi:hypothetical protein